MFLRVSHGFHGLFYTFSHAFLQVLSCVSSRFTHFTFYSEFTCKVKCEMLGVFHGKITIPAPRAPLQMLEHMLMLFAPANVEKTCSTFSYILREAALECIVNRSNRLPQPGKD